MLSYEERWGDQWGRGVYCIMFQTPIVLQVTKVTAALLSLLSCHLCQIPPPCYLLGCILPPEVIHHLGCCLACPPLPRHSPLPNPLLRPPRKFPLLHKPGWCAINEKKKFKKKNESVFLKEKEISRILRKDKIYICSQINSLSIPLNRV